jgi:hypothetical protein
VDSEWIIGALALFTIGGVLAVAIFHFRFHLKDPKNLEAAKAVAEDRESAATRVSTEGVNGRSLRQRLDDAPGINDRLSNRRTGDIGIMNVLFDAPWSSLRAGLNGKPLYPDDVKQSPPPVA